MDITPQDATQQQPISDDQELAKALAGVIPDAPESSVPSFETPTLETPALQFEETPAPAVTLPSLPPVEPLQPVQAPEPVFSAPTPVSSPASSDLEGIKQKALEQLRPLIGKFELPAEEKFDIYLMLIRSTDDASLIGPANETAQAISDEKRRAEALLDIIKEIDYLSRNQQPAA